MKKRDDQFHNEPWDRDYYGTGSTQPPKNYGGVIAALLIAVIVLGSITTYLGILNIRLFRLLELQDRQEENVQLLQPQETDSSVPAQEETAVPGNAGMLNVRCSTVSDFDARFYTLPYGCLVTEVIEGGGADRAGICTGDVILSLNGKPVKTVEMLAQTLGECTAGQQVSVEVYRSRTQKNLTIKVILDERGENQ